MALQEAVKRVADASHARKGCHIVATDLRVGARLCKKPAVNLDPVQLRVALPAANPPDIPVTTLTPTASPQQGFAV